MATPRDIAVIVGSLRKESLNRKMAKTLIGIAPKTLRLEIVEIRALALFDEDIEASPPAEWTAFRERIGRADGVLFVTPEYNRSMPGVLKNAIDVASRPYGKNMWNGKPGAVISVSQGAIGGFGANHHLRQSLVFLNVPALQQPEAYVGGAARLFDENGQLANDATREFLDAFMKAYAAWVEKILAAPA
ncbi:MAG TPA: NAD(P)H-dependent oxidoreductase [Rhodanobacteraceae bacterium]|jgi:chromate reductase|nr:NAD(P)H-dependent oxidoreductase [Rhodanobacteraceae bacterium]